MRGFFGRANSSMGQDDIEMIDLASAQYLLQLQADIATKEQYCIELNEKIQREKEEESSLIPDTEIEIAVIQLLNIEYELSILRQKLKKEWPDAPECEPNDEIWVHTF